MKTILLNTSFALLVLISLSSCSFTQKQSTAKYEIASKQVYDIIVVPGAPFENEQWSLTMKGRILWSKHLYDEGITKNIMYSGSAVYTPYLEAEIMKSYAMALGIPNDKLFVELEAQHSTENIYFSYLKAKQLGFNKIALATDPFQSKMLQKMIKKRINDDVDIIPIVFEILGKMDENNQAVTIDHTPLYIANFKPITEREGFWERFRGTRGKNIDFTSNNEHLNNKE